MPALNIKLDKYATAPSKGHSNDAGLDLRSTEDTVIPARGFALIHTGVHVEIPECCVGLLTSKSGLMRKGITSTGTIDCGYTGEIMAVLFNHSDKDFYVEAGDKITQLVVMRLYGYDDLQLDVLETEDIRGNNGFGSTGK